MFNWCDVCCCCTTGICVFQYANEGVWQMSGVQNSVWRPEHPPPLWEQCFQMMTIILPRDDLFISYYYCTIIVGCVYNEICSYFCGNWGGSEIDSEFESLMGSLQTLVTARSYVPYWVFITTTRRPSGHRNGGELSSLIITMSPACRLWWGDFHFCLCWSPCKYSTCQWRQNCCWSAWTSW